jgi:hypothetical protein
MKNIGIIILIIFTYNLVSVEIDIEHIKSINFGEAFGATHDRLIVEHPYLYAVTVSGLAIFEIGNDDELTKLSHLPIVSAAYFTKADDYIYLLTSNFVGSYLKPYTTPLTLHQIDVSDKHNPQIINSIEYDSIENNRSINIVGEYLQAGSYQFASDIYTIPDLEYITSLPPSVLPGYHVKLHEISDNIAVDQSPGYGNIDIYDYSDIENLELISTIDVWDIHGDHLPGKFTVIRDTLLMMAGQTCLSFWDISDTEDWTYLSSFSLDSDMIWRAVHDIIENWLMIVYAQDGLYLVDITDIYDPVILDHHDLFYKNINCGVFNESNNTIYIPSDDDEGILQVYLNESTMEFEYIGEYLSYPVNSSLAGQYMDLIFLDSDYYGIYMYDLSDPLNPSIIEIEAFKDLSQPKILDNYLIAKVDGDLNQDEFYLNIYDITVPTMPGLIDQIVFYDVWDFIFSQVVTDPYVDDVFYVHTRYPDSIIRKYQIESNSVELLFYEDGFTAPRFVVNDGYGYILTNHQHAATQDLHVVGGLHDNQPYLANAIPGFSNYDDTVYLYTNNYLDHLVLFSPNHESHLYEIQTDPHNPEFVFQLEYPLNMYLYYEDIIFASPLMLGSRVTFLYDISGEVTGTITHETYFEEYSQNYSFIYETNSTTYMYNIGRSHLSLYELNITPISADDPAIIPPDMAFANFPNPFNTETTFAINLPDIEDDAVIELYNIKGQLIRKLEVPPSEDSVTHITWDGRDSKGRVVASGIYLAKLRNGSETQTHRVVLLK